MPYAIDLRDFEADKKYRIYFQNGDRFVESFCGPGNDCRKFLNYNFPEGATVLGLAEKSNPDRSRTEGWSFNIGDKVNVLIHDTDKKGKIDRYPATFGQTEYNFIMKQLGVKVLDVELAEVSQDA